MWRDTEDRSRSAMVGREGRHSKLGKCCSTSTHSNKGRYEAGDWKLRPQLTAILGHPYASRDLLDHRCHFENNNTILPAKPLFESHFARKRVAEFWQCRLEPCCEHLEFFPQTLKAHIFILLISYWRSSNPPLRGAESKRKGQENKLSLLSGCLSIETLLRPAHTSRFNVSFAPRTHAHHAKKKMH